MNDPRNTLTVGALLDARKFAPRLICDIAADIRAHWDPVNYGAEPYLAAMSSLGGIEENYMYDSARSVVLYFLSNARTWKGEHARRIKAELKAL